MFLPGRIRKLVNRHSLVDTVPFTLPVQCEKSPVLMAIFDIDANKAKALMPYEVHPLKLWNGRGALIVTVIDYKQTNIGKYIEYSIAIACTRGLKPAPPIIPALLMKLFNAGQYVVDLPVSSEVSVKGGKGIWGMPKHQGNLDFKISDDKVSSQYDLDGKLVAYAEIKKPDSFRIPVPNVSADNYCSFRGMLMKSRIYIQGNASFCFGKNAQGRFVLGEHERNQPLRDLDMNEKPFMTAFIPDAIGTLDDHIETWFLTESTPWNVPGEGMESVVNLSLSEEWPAPPNTAIRAWNEVLQVQTTAEEPVTASVSEKGKTAKRKLPEIEKS